MALTIDDGVTVTAWPAEDSGRGLLCSAALPWPPRGCACPASPMRLPCVSMLRGTQRGRATQRATLWAEQCQGVTLLPSHPPLSNVSAAMRGGRRQWPPLDCAVCRAEAAKCTAGLLRSPVPAQPQKGASATGPTAPAQKGASATGPTATGHDPESATIVIPCSQSLCALRVVGCLPAIQQLCQLSRRQSQSGRCVRSCEATEEPQRGLTSSGGAQCGHDHSRRRRTR